MLPMLDLNPFQKLLRGVIELANQDSALRLTSLPKGAPMFRLHFESLRHVLFCGGQVGCSAVLLAVQLEAVMPYSAAIPQCHSSPPELGPSSTFQRGPSDTKYV